MIKTVQENTCKLKKARQLNQMEEKWICFKTITGNQREQTYQNIDTDTLQVHGM